MGGRATAHAGQAPSGLRPPPALPTAEVGRSVRTPSGVRLVTPSPSFGTPWKRLRTLAGPRWMTQPAHLCSGIPYGATGVATPHGGVHRQLTRPVATGKGGRGGGGLDQVRLRLSSLILQAAQCHRPHDSGYSCLHAPPNVAKDNAAFPRRQHRIRGAAHPLGGATPAAAATGCFLHQPVGARGLPPPPGTPHPRSDNALSSSQMCGVPRAVAHPGYAERLHTSHLREPTREATGAQPETQRPRQLYRGRANPLGQLPLHAQSKSIAREHQQAGHLVGHERARGAPPAAKHVAKGIGGHLHRPLNCLPWHHLLHDEQGHPAE